MATRTDQDVMAEIEPLLPPEWREVARVIGANELLRMIRALSMPEPISL